MKVKLETLYLEFKTAAQYKWVRRLLSMPFLLMLFASFVLWYIAKLSYTYTTEIEVKIKVEGQKTYTTCVVEGVGTYLVGYKIHNGGAVHIPLSTTPYTMTTLEDDPNEYILIDQEVVNRAISVHYSDIKVISVEPCEPIEVTKRIKKIIEQE